MTARRNNNLIPDRSVPAEDVQEDEMIAHVITTLFNGIANTAPVGDHWLVTPKDMAINDAQAMGCDLTIGADSNVYRQEYGPIIDHLVSQAKRDGKAPIHLISLKWFASTEVRTWVIGADASVADADEVWKGWAKKQKYLKGFSLVEPWHIPMNLHDND